jgi:hypothetical protein
MSRLLIDLHLIVVVDFFHEVLHSEVQVIVGIGQLRTSVLEIVDSKD